MRDTILYHKLSTTGGNIFTFTPLVSLLNNHVLGLWEEAEVQTVNSHKYRETMKIHQNQDLLTVRHQYKPLHYCATPGTTLNLKIHKL